MNTPTRRVLDDATRHALECAHRHRRVYVIWVRERTLQPLQGLDRQGEESSVYQSDLTIFVRPANPKPVKATRYGPNPNANPKDAYIYARVYPSARVEYTDEEP